MIFACEYCGGVLEPAVIAGVTAIWGWGCYLLCRLFGWIKPWRPWRRAPVKPPCQSCGNFIWCAMGGVGQCPKIKRRPWYQFWRTA